MVCNKVQTNIPHLNLAFFILDIGKQVLWQTVKTQMKCCIRQHFIRVCTVCYKDKNNLQGQKKHHFIESLTSNPLKYLYKNGQIHTCCINMYGIIHWNENKLPGSWLVFSSLTSAVIAGPSFTLYWDLDRSK